MLSAATIRRLVQFSAMDVYTSPVKTRLAYFVHDLNDPAVARRLMMLQPHLSSAVVIGFHRGASPPPMVAGWPVIDLGRTSDGKLGARAIKVLQRLIYLQPLASLLKDATLIIARQLEMLALASAGRRRYAKNAILIYECLDIHKMLLGSRVLRRVESHLLRGVDRIIVSAPAFVDAYLGPTHGAALPPVSLIENKILKNEMISVPAEYLRLGEPPWRIGWFGILRCRRSLLLLIELTRRLPGLINVELRGRPALAAIPDFHALVANAPDLTFHGAYDRSTDLAAIYHRIHFTWTIDFYEAGQNSAWLLPNRLYEGGAHGAVPIAVASVATGQWLARHGAGILLDEPMSASLYNFFAALESTTYACASAKVAEIASPNWIDDGEDAHKFMSEILTSAR